MISNGFDIECDQLAIEWFARTESTNKLARESATRNQTLWIADFQTNGRGQRGNHWHSAEGVNLMFTLSLFPDSVAAENQFQISIDCIGQGLNTVGSQITDDGWR